MEEEDRRQNRVRLGLDVPGAVRLERALVEEASAVELDGTLVEEASWEVAYLVEEGDALLVAQVAGADAAAEVEEEEEPSAVPSPYLVARVGRPIRLQEEQGMQEALQTARPIRLS